MGYDINKVRETVLYGSPHEALINGFLTPGDIVNYLLTMEHQKTLSKDPDSETNKDNPETDKESKEQVNKPTVEEMIAYRAVCQFSRQQIVKDHPISDFNNKPFILLTNYDEYVGIYNLTIGSEHSARTDKEQVEISRKAQRVWPKLITVTKFSRNLFLICDTDNIKKIRSNERETVVKARSVKLITNNYKKLVANYTVWINSDYLVPLDDIKFDFYEKNLLNRCKFMKLTAPLYWEGVAKSLYQELINKNISEESFEWTYRDIDLYKELFPDVLPESIVNISKFKLNMKTLPPVLQAYILGYPIHEYIPSEEIIEQSIDLVDKIGSEKYSNLIEERNRKMVYSQPCTLSVSIPSEIFNVGNEKDAMLEEVWKYNMFDVVRCYEGKHVYHFTRPEFVNILTNKKNIWTNKIIHTTVLYEMEARNRMALAYALPAASTIKTLIIKTEAGELYKRDIGPGEPIESESPDLGPLIPPPLPPFPHNQDSNGDNNEENNGDSNGDNNEENNEDQGLGTRAWGPNVWSNLLSGPLSVPLSGTVSNSSYGSLSNQLYDMLGDIANNNQDVLSSMDEMISLLEENGFLFYPSDFNYSYGWIPSSQSNSAENNTVANDGDNNHPSNDDEMDNDEENRSD